MDAISLFPCAGYVQAILGDSTAFTMKIMTTLAEEAQFATLNKLEYNLPFRILPIITTEKT